jgi:hypothetical protein
MKLLTAIGRDMLQEFSSPWLPQYYNSEEQAFIRYKPAAPWKSTIYHLLQSLPSLPNCQCLTAGQILKDSDFTRVLLMSFISRTALWLLLQRFWCLLEAFSPGSGFRSNEKVYSFHLF